MSTQDVHRYRSKLDNLFKVINSLPVEDEQIKSHWARYLCVLVCGYLEVAVTDLLGQYALNCANENVANYVESQLRGFQNPKMEKILQIVGAFDKDWQTTLTQFVSGRPKDAIDSIVNNRHQIAHGKDTGLTYASIRDYYDQAQKVVDQLETLCAAPVPKKKRK